METLETSQFDIIVTDFSLGDGTAIDILNLVKDIPIIITTGAGDEDVAVKAWKAGAYDYLSKDCNREYLKVLPKTIENVIKRKEIEDALERKQRNLEAIFDAVPVGLLFADENFLVTRANDAITKVFQKDYSHIIGKKIGEAIDCLNNVLGQQGCGNNPECASCIIRKNINNTLANFKPMYNVEAHPTFLINNKQTQIWLSISVVPVIVDNCKHVIVAVDDITERKQAEEKVRETMELKSQFISTVSHELRTPMAAMKEAIALVLDEAVGKINDKQRKFLDIASRNVERLGDLINDVLDFQKLEAGKMNLDIKQNDINQVVSEVYEIMVLFAKKHKVELVTELDTMIPQAQFDKTKMIQVLTNLISNAIKFTPENGKVTVRAFPVRDSDNGNILELALSVSDTGMGIPQEAISKIFDRFYRVKREGKEIQGTGLGLAIVNKIITMHGGRIDIESQVDKGTTFTVYLPMEHKVSPENVSVNIDNKLEKIIT